jgi:hypothetical protein
VSLLDRHLVRDLESPVRDLQERDINLAREIEVELLQRILDEAVLMPLLAAAFTERLLVLLGSRR